MYTSFYNLSVDPFQLSPDPRFYFESLSHKKAMAYLTYGLHRNEGFIVIYGDTGKGKTTLARKLLSGLDPETFVSAHLVTTQLDPSELVQMIAIRFGIGDGTMGKAATLEKLTNFLQESLAAGKRPLLVVDEAQNLSRETLEELRMLSNIEHDHRSALQILFLAQPGFLELTMEPSLSQFRDRIIASIDLGSLNRSDMQGYIEHRLAVAGWTGDQILTDDALDAVHRHTAGVPRRINRLCSRILLTAALDETQVVDAALVVRVIAELSDDPSYEHLRNEPNEGEEPDRTAKIEKSNGALDQRIESIEQDLKSQDRLLKQLLDLFMDHLRSSKAP